MSTKFSENLRAEATVEDFPHLSCGNEKCTVSDSVCVQRVVACE